MRLLEFLQPTGDFIVPLGICFFRGCTLICCLALFSQIPIQIANFVAPFLGLVTVKTLKSIEEISLTPRRRHFDEIAFLRGVIDKTDDSLDLRVICPALAHIAAN